MALSPLTVCLPFSAPPKDAEVETTVGELAKRCSREGNTGALTCCSPSLHPSPTKTWHENVSNTQPNLQQPDIEQEALMRPGMLHPLTFLFPFRLPR